MSACSAALPTGRTRRGSRAEASAYRASCLLAGTNTKSDIVTSKRETSLPRSGHPRTETRSVTASPAFGDNSDQAALSSPGAAEQRGGILLYQKTRHYQMPSAGVVVVAGNVTPASRCPCSIACLRGGRPTKWVSCDESLGGRRVARGFGLGRVWPILRASTSLKPSRVAGVVSGSLRR